MRRVLASLPLTMAATEKRVLDLRGAVCVRLRSTSRTHVWYTMIVKVTSTEFRKNLFQIFERAIQGEFIEVLHKGRVVRLVPGDKPSKISRLIQRDTIHGTPEDLDHGQKQLDSEMRTSWDEKWAPKA
jgi:antitoxin (DNA-binding transcriptional repressor) of toxin-antitoxin stability system